MSHVGPVTQEETEPAETPFPELRYDRVCRTGHSEAYLLSQGETPLGRVDLHYGGSVVHAVLVIEHDLTDQEVRGLVQRIDDDLVWTADQPREDFLVTVYRGTEIGVISDRDQEEDLEEDEQADDGGDGQR
jgi:hypothetical protein